ncbi:hypothetical protein [Oceanithermus desulfurans]|uniref:hypothetical protein n=1 Tax=Oceanithermus desulfurans TaxID=227924 RepID=UPI0011BDDD1F|nr:hypothetical protein [Oceanithermus desulfurans]
MAYRLVCRFGWNDETTRSFWSRRFEVLELSGGRDQAFRIPDLGEKALELKSIKLGALGVVEGLEQFKNLEHLYVDAWPKNGLDLRIFPRLRRLHIHQVKPAEKQLSGLPDLIEIGIAGYTGLDGSLFSSMKHLQSLTLVQGRLRSLEGLEDHPKLKSMELSLVRNLVDLRALDRLSRLEHLHLQQLPKATGMIRIRTFPKMRTFYVAGSHKELRVDMAGLRELKHLQKLWVMAGKEHFGFEDVFLLPHLTLAGFTSPTGTPGDDELRSLAGRHGRQLTKIHRARSKGVDVIQLNFHPYEAGEPG